MDKQVFDSFPLIETERLIMRQVKEKDAPQIFEFNSNLESLKYIARDPWTQMEQGIEKTNILIKGFEEKKAIWWAFTLKGGSHQSIGYGGLFNISFQDHKAELGYGLLQPYWGKGIVSEAIKECVDFGINKLKLHRIYAIIDPENTPSKKIVSRLGFVQEGILKDNAFARNRYFDHCVYALISNK